MEGHAARQPDRRRPFRVACGGDRDQRRHQRRHVAACRPHLGIHRVEQRGIGIEIKVVDEQTAQPEAEKLDGPAVFRPGAAVYLLDQHQPHHGEQHQPHIACPSRQYRLGGGDEGHGAGEQQTDDKHASQGSDQTQRRWQGGARRQAQPQDIEQQRQPGAVARDFGGELRPRRQHPPRGERRQGAPGGAEPGGEHQQTSLWALAPAGNDEAGQPQVG